ncbi:hypothetical protein HGM15179_020062, partial [Zosterops borbonicus]
WRLTVDYRRLNANTDPLTAAVPNIMLKTFFMIPIQQEDMDRFAFTSEGQQYTFTRLPQGYRHSSTLARHALAQELEEIPKPDTVAVYQYIDDILVGTEEQEVVRDVQQKIISHL